ncbi:MAG: hypothetical protein MRERC_3c016 [Mycoplasmataceae bacterium RC_NB112A]|nr:MAG: hypothetical protein MRERC_3c016 [Mycoplasmataceae bacterium RC_NB112A]
MLGVDKFYKYELVLFDLKEGGIEVLGAEETAVPPIPNVAEILVDLSADNLYENAGNIGRVVQEYIDTAETAGVADLNNLIFDHADENISHWGEKIRNVDIDLITMEDVDPAEVARHQLTEIAERVLNFVQDKWSEATKKADSKTRINLKLKRLRTVAVDYYKYEEFEVIYDFGHKEKKLKIYSTFFSGEADEYERGLKFSTKEIYRLTSEGSFMIDKENGIIQTTYTTIDGKEEGIAYEFEKVKGRKGLDLQPEWLVTFKADGVNYEKFRVISGSEEEELIFYSTFLLMI